MLHPQHVFVEINIFFLISQHEDMLWVLIKSETQVTFNEFPQPVKNINTVWLIKKALSR